MQSEISSGRRGRARAPLTAIDGVLWPSRSEYESERPAPGSGSLRLRWSGDEPLDGTWAVQLNLALTAGEAAGRYYGSWPRLWALAGEDWVTCSRRDDGSAGSRDRWSGTGGRLAPIETVSSRSRIRADLPGLGHSIRCPSVAAGRLVEGELRIIPRALLSAALSASHTRRAAIS